MPRARTIKPGEEYQGFVVMTGGAESRKRGKRYLWCLSTIG